MLYRVQPTPTTPTTISGRNIAHGRRLTIERALLGADLYMGRVALVYPTLEQCRVLAGVCRQYIRAAVAIVDDAEARAEVLAGSRPLLDSYAGEALATHLKRVTSSERLEAAREVGPAFLWDEMVNPLL